MVELIATMKFILETRRSYVDGTITPWRVVYTGNENDVIEEKKAHLESGYNPDNLRIVRITQIAEVWDQYVR